MESEFITNYKEVKIWEISPEKLHYIELIATKFYQ